MKRGWAGALLSLWLGVLAIPAQAAVLVTGATLQGQGAAGAVLTLELSDRTRGKLFHLEAPDRVVVDLEGTQLGPGVRLPQAAGPVTTLRHGVQPGSTLRVVLETSGRHPARVDLEGSAQEGWRLVVALGQVDRAAASARPATPAAVKKQAASAPAPARPAAPGRDIIVAIDAGHGGRDPGALGRSGTQEKDVVLGIARALARRIDAEPGMRAVLTRNSDVFIPLRDRMKIAREARADIFVSVHADSIQNRAVSGSSVYVLSERGASSEAARWLAERENAADLKGGISLAEQGALASVLMDLSQTASIGSSMEAAERVLFHMDRVGQVRKSQVQQAPFVVLKSPDIPSMLVETAYISNPDEEKKLRTPAHQERIAQAIFQGVRDYFRASPPDGTLFAQARGRGASAPIMAINAGR